MDIAAFPLSSCHLNYISLTSLDLILRQDVTTVGQDGAKHILVLELPGPPGRRGQAEAGHCLLDS